MIQSQKLSRRSFARMCAGAAAAATAAPLFVYAAAAGFAPKPNIIKIMVDDLGWGDVAFTKGILPGATNEHPRPSTPHLDRWAHEGMIFRQFYSASCVCSPTRAASLTGVDNNYLGIAYACCNDNGGLPWGIPTLANQLKRAGYRTAFIGKWHVGGDGYADILKRKRGEKSTHPGPADHGFDDAARYPMSGSACFKDLPDGVYQDGQKCMVYNDRFPDTPMHSDPKFGNDKHAQFLDSDNLIDCEFNWTMHFMQNYEAENQPFFIQLWPFVPHASIQAIPAYMKAAGNDRLTSMLLCLDANMGRLYDKLHELGLAESTLVFFSSDNGPQTYRSAPLKGYKFNFWEGGIRVPTFAYWKGSIQAGSITDAVGHSSDYLPTFCELADIKPQKASAVRYDGVSLVPAFKNAGTKTPNRTLYFNRTGNRRGILIDGRWKLVFGPDGSGPYYYDIQEDVFEKNEGAIPSEMKTRLSNELAAYIQSLPQNCKSKDSGSPCFKPDWWKQKHPDAIANVDPTQAPDASLWKNMRDLNGNSISISADRIQLNLKKRENTSLHIVNGRGQTMFAFRGYLSAGRNRIPLKASVFSQGVYYLKASIGSRRHTIKFISNTNIY